MLRALYDPDTFFDRLSNEEVSLRGPAIVVLLNAAVAMAPTYLLMEEILSALPPRASSFATVGMAIGAVSAFVGVFALWIIGSAVLHGTSSLLGGEGSFRRTVQFVGYGFLPSLIGAVVGAVVLVQVLPTIQFDLSDPAAMQRAMQGNTALAASNVVNGLFYLWSANIWVFGMTHFRGLSLKQSLVAAGVPAALLVVWQLRNAAGILV